MSTDMEEMAERIARNEAPPASIGVPQSDTALFANFPVSGVHWTAIFAPFAPIPGREEGRKSYGLSIKAEELHPMFLDGARVRMQDGQRWVSIRQSAPPALVKLAGRYDLATTLQSADSCQFSKEKLLREIPLTLAVRKHSYDWGLSVVAIGIDTDLLVARYDNLCAEYFTGD